MVSFKASSLTVVPRAKQHGSILLAVTRAARSTYQRMSSNCPLFSHFPVISYCELQGVPSRNERFSQGNWTRAISKCNCLLP